MAIRERLCRANERRSHEVRSRSTSPIVLVTDFGDSLAMAECKIAIAETSRQIGLTRPVDVTSIPDVASFNKVHGTFTIAQVAKRAPEGTVFVGVINPGVGTSREGLL